MGNEKSSIISADFKNTFGFLIRDFGFTVYFEGYTKTSGNNYIYILNNSYIQLEFAGDLSWFHLELRNIIDGNVTPYSDKINNIGFESLATLESQGKYNHFDYYVVSTGWKNVLTNTANLLRRNPTVLNTKSWIDSQKLNSIEDDVFYQRFGFHIENNIPSFFEQMHEQVAELFNSSNYHCIFNSSELAPYDINRHSRKVVYNNSQNDIAISQRDWRDCPNVYIISLNDTQVAEIDLTNFNKIDDALIITIDRIKSLLSYVYYY